MTWSVKKLGCHLLDFLFSKWKLEELVERTLHNVYGIGSPTVGPTSSFRLHIYVPSHIWLKYRWMWR